LGDRAIRWTTALVVVAVALIAAYVSYHHAYELVSRHGEQGITARVVPLTVDGLVLASSLVLLHTARQRSERRLSILAWSFLALGIAATLGANVAHGLGHGPIGAVVAAWPAAALVGSYELLVSLVRERVRASTNQNKTPPTTEPPHQTNHENRPPPPTPRDPVPPFEYDENAQNGQNEHQNGTHENAALLTEARAIAQQYLNQHQRWITRDELRNQLRCSTKRAGELLRTLKTEITQ
jgi:hypothetical protein